MEANICVTKKENKTYICFFTLNVKKSDSSCNNNGAKREVVKVMKQNYTGQIYCTISQIKVAAQVTKCSISSGVQIKDSPIQGFNTNYSQLTLFFNN